jgi:hypothetical protein
VETDIDYVSKHCGALSSLKRVCHHGFIIQTSIALSMRTLNMLAHQINLCRVRLTKLIFYAYQQIFSYFLNLICAINVQGRAKPFGRLRAKQILPPE